MEPPPDVCLDDEGLTVFVNGEIPANYTHLGHGRMHPLSGADDLLGTEYPVAAEHDAGVRVLGEALVELGEGEGRK